MVGVGVCLVLRKQLSLTAAVGFDATPSQGADQDGSTMVDALLAVSAPDRRRNRQRVCSKSERAKCEAKGTS